jgi:rod shape-determining protein MreC
MDSFVAQAILDKGKKDDVYVGQPVLGASGIMGQVVQVNHWTSRLMLITDTRSAVPVVDERTGLRAIVLGTGPFRPLVLINIPDTADIAVGDKLATSGLGLLYPAGYPVGVVIKVRKQTGQQFAQVLVSPTAHLYRDTQVLLLWHSQAEMVKEATTELETMKQENKDINQQVVDRVRDGG